MQYRVLTFFVVIAIVLCSSFGCASEVVNNNEVTDMIDSLSKLNVVPNAAAIESGVSQEQMDIAVVSQGNVASIAKLMRKANNGEDITYVSLGGSITAGSNSTTQDKCYASLTYAWWKKSFPKSNVSFYNMGIGATTSTLGVHRLEKDVLSKNPDFVIIEFAVNDRESDADTEAYENIVRRLLKQNPDVAILSLYMTTEAAWNCQNAEHPMLDHYQIPQISYKDVLFDMIDNEKRYKWSDISRDDVHPNDIGHALAASLVTSFLDAVKEKCECISDTPTKLPEPMFGERYMNATLYMGGDIEITSEGSWEETPFDYYHLHGAWKTSGLGDPMTVNAEGSEVSLVFKKMVSDPDAGKIKILVDGKEAVIIDTSFPGGWGDYMAIEKIFTDDKIAKHELSIQCIEGNVTICGLLIA